MNVQAKEEYALRPLVEGDLDLVLAWRNSERVRRFMFTSHIISPAEHKAWFDRLAASATDRCLIFERLGQPLGVASFTGISGPHKRAVWGFYIGIEDAPKGLGSALGRLSLKYAFDELGLHKVVGEVLTFNEPSLRLFRRLGFLEEGTLYDEVWRDGAPMDVIRFAMVYDRWRMIQGEG